MISVKVLFFASIKERTGVKETQLQLPENVDVGSFKLLLAERYPEVAASLNSVIISINREFAFDVDPIPEGAEIAVFPPVSGGNESQETLPTVICVTENAIDFEKLISQVTLPTTGAACIFSGMVRGVTTLKDVRETLYLEYEAYHQMAESKMWQVVEEIREQWPAVIGIAMVQRLGRLDPGTPTVLIVCTAAHRNTGVFEAAKYGIDRLKEIVPVWKKEVSPHGEMWVEGDYFPKQGE